MEAQGDLLKLGDEAAIRKPNYRPKQVAHHGTDFVSNKRLLSPTIPVGNLSLVLHLDRQLSEYSHRDKSRRFRKHIEWISRTCLTESF